LQPVNEHAVQVLNSLIETTFDSAESYGKAADLARNPRFQDFFRHKAESRLQLAEGLKQAVRNLEGEPVDQGSAAGPLHQGILVLRDRVGGNSDKPLIEEVKLGETFVRYRFERAAQDHELPSQARAEIDRTLGQVAADHDVISALRDEFG
jgi:uncharacterized protein (TIGR02284 family)